MDGIEQLGAGVIFMAKQRRIEMMRNRIIHVLHRVGLYRIMDTGRDYMELFQARRRSSFSQYGEDVFLQQYFKGRKGFYIDIGANHPIRGSNTYKLYQNGWEGLTVEPIKRLYDKHKKFRPRDIQVNAAVGRSPCELTFHEMIPSVLSTCDFEVAKETVSKSLGILLDRYVVPVSTGADLCRKYVVSRTISLLCVDAEGYDLAILEGIAWTDFKPELIVCEANEPSEQREIEKFLNLHGYSCIKSFGGSFVFGRY